MAEESERIGGTDGMPRGFILFSSEAWLKMTLLIAGMKGEIAWHGIAVRGSNPYSYVIDDILVYPQEVSSSYVSMDDEEYSKWLTGDDPRLSYLRMQGHSHARMMPFPSVTDLEHQKTIRSQLGKNDFYIFMIWNKDLEHFFRIFDNKYNTTLENSEIDFGIDNKSIKEFRKEVQKYVKTSEFEHTYGRYIEYNGFNKEL